MNELSKYYIIIFFLKLTLIPSASYSQINKPEAALWLNNKMELGLTGVFDTIQSNILKKPVLMFRHTNFSDCIYSGKLWDMQINVLENTEIKRNETIFSVDLSLLNPYSFIKVVLKDRFYYKVLTKNSTKKIVYKYTDFIYPTVSTSNESFVLIGPFSIEEQGLDVRVKNVLTKLIISCGGRKDSF